MLDRLWELNSWLDRHLLRLAKSTRTGISENSYNALREAAYREAAHQDSEKNSLDFLQEQFNAIDQKASALLTHISLMIAALSIFVNITVTSNPILSIVGEVMILAYLGVTVCCLRTIRIIGPNNIKDSAGLVATAPAASDITRVLAAHLEVRREIYKLCLRTTVSLTMIFAALTLLYVTFRVVTLTKEAMRPTAANSSLVTKP